MAECVIIVILILIIAAMLVIYFSFRDSGNAPKFFGYYIYQTHAVNMEPDIPAESVVFSKADAVDSIGEGSVVLCQIDNSFTIIKVKEMLSEESGDFYIVKYNTSLENDTYKIPVNSVVAKAMYYDEFMGDALTFITSETGIIVLAIIPSILIVIFQVVKIIIIQKNSDDEDYDYSFDEEEPVNLYQPETSSSERRRSLDTPLVSYNDYLPPERNEPVEDFPPVRAKFDTEKEKKAESSFKIDRSGKAVFELGKNNGNVLITDEKLDVMQGKAREKTLYSADAFTNESVRIPEDEYVRTDPVSELMKGEDESMKTVYNGSNVIPERIAGIKTSAYPAEPQEEQGKARRFSKPKAVPEIELPHDFFSLEKEPEAVPVFTQSDKIIAQTNSIPVNSVVPEESIAPRKKKKSNKTVEELMELIDAEQKKINERL